jgi:hypothetical protein
MKWFKRVILSLGILFLIYFGVVMLFVLTPDINDYFDRAKFESKVWIEWKDDVNEQKVRWNMTNDLIKNYALIGKNISEIKKLLGNPSFEDKHELNYFLGLTGHGINTGSLKLKLKNNKVISYKIWQG